MRISQGASFLVVTVALGAVSTASVSSAALVGWSRYDISVTAPEVVGPVAPPLATVRAPKKEEPPPASPARQAVMAERERAGTAADQDLEVLVQAAVTATSVPTPPADPGLVPPLLSELSDGITVIDGSVAGDSDEGLQAGGVDLPGDPLPSPSSTDAPTDAPTDPPSDAPTDPPTDAPTDAPTDVPTDAPTAPPTDAPRTDLPHGRSHGPTDGRSHGPADRRSHGPADGRPDGCRHGPPDRSVGRAHRSRYAEPGDARPRRASGSDGRPVGAVAGAPAPTRRPTTGRAGTLRGVDVPATSTHASVSAPRPTAGPGPRLVARARGHLPTARRLETGPASPTSLAIRPPRCRPARRPPRGRPRRCPRRPTRRRQGRCRPDRSRSSRPPTHRHLLPPRPLLRRPPPRSACRHHHHQRLGLCPPLRQRWRCQRPPPWRRPPQPWSARPRHPHRDLGRTVAPRPTARTARARAAPPRPPTRPVAVARRATPAAAAAPTAPTAAGSRAADPSG